MTPGIVLHVSQYSLEITQVEVTSGEFDLPKSRHTYDIISEIKSIGKSSILPPYTQQHVTIYFGQNWMHPC